MQEQLEVIDAVARAVDRITRRGKYADFELTNGIVLVIKPVPPLLLSAVVEEFEDPSPPVVFMEEKGRDEPNPNDPKYVEELKRIATARELAVNNLMLAVGTAIKSVPEGYYKPEEDDWIDQVEFANKLLGTDIKIEREDKTKRYLNWLMFYALESTSDVFLAQNLSLQLSGLREGEVDEVFNSFQRLPERRADNGGSAETGSENGDRNPGTRRRGRPRA